VAARRSKKSCTFKAIQYQKAVISERVLPGVSTWRTGADFEPSSCWATKPAQKYDIDATALAAIARFYLNRYL